MSEHFAGKMKMLLQQRGLGSHKRCVMAHFIEVSRPSRQIKSVKKWTQAASYYNAIACQPEWRNSCSHIADNWTYTHRWVYTIFSRFGTCNGLLLNKPIMYEAKTFRLPPDISVRNQEKDSWEYKMCIETNCWLIYPLIK